MRLEVGQRASRTRKVSAEDIELFARASGDTNPIHLDESYAATTQFKHRIAHGMLTASFISAVLASDLPGPGGIYLGQDLKFKAPVFIGDEITTTVEVIKYREDRRIATCQTTCTNQDGKVVIEGEAVILAPPGE
ncbi:MAG TPA: MaoC family dehydratase [Aggregatilineales bacterium]|nr:MaoC family dehydratase [Aggregatilineales bacterium]